MLNGEETMPEDGTCPEPDEELAPLSRNQPKEKTKTKTNWNRKCNLQDFQNNL